LRRQGKVNKGENSENEEGVEGEDGLKCMEGERVEKRGKI